MIVSYPGLGMLLKVADLCTWFKCYWLTSNLGFLKVCFEVFCKFCCLFVFG